MEPPADGGVITGLVDWDLAGPGRLIEDLAYVAWHFVPLHGEPMSQVDGFLIRWMLQ